MKIRRIRIWLSRGWYRTLCSISLLLLPLFCNTGRAFAAISHVQQDTIKSTVVVSGSKPQAGDMISGIVRDENGPIQWANITERDSSYRIVSHAIADENGKFAFKLVNPANRLSVTYVEYWEAVSEFTGSFFEIKMVETNLPTVDLIRDAKRVTMYGPPAVNFNRYYDPNAQPAVRDFIEIGARTPDVSVMYGVPVNRLSVSDNPQTLDSIPVPERLECVPEFSPDNFRLPEGVTLDSVIRKLPGVEVLSDGSITVDGRLVSKILLSNQLEAVGSTLQDDIFGLRIGMPVSEQEIVKLFSERYNAHVDIPSREASIVYHVRNIQYLGFDWNHVFLYVDKDDNTLKSVELNLIVPHNFDFAPTKEDSINIVTAKVGEALDSQYGEPTRNFGGTVWHGPNDVDILLGVDRSARTVVSDPRREGLTTEAMIIQVLYLKKNG